MLKIIVIVLIAGILSLAGQIFYKKSLNAIRARKYLNFLKKALSSPLIWLGFVCIAVSLIVTLVALSLADLNIVYLLDSMSYILTLAAARIFLSEKIDRNKLTGTLFVVFGIILVAVS